MKYYFQCLYLKYRFFVFDSIKVYMFSKNKMRDKYNIFSSAVNMYHKLLCGGYATTCLGIFRMLDDN